MFYCSFFFSRSGTPSNTTTHVRLRNYASSFISYSRRLSLGMSAMGKIILIWPFGSALNNCPLGCHSLYLHADFQIKWPRNPHSLMYAVVLFVWCPLLDGDNPAVTIAGFSPLPSSSFPELAFLIYWVGFLTLN